MKKSCHQGHIISHIRALFFGEQDEVGDGAHEDEDAVEGERDEEEIEVSVVPLAHTVTHPGTVVVEALHTVVTDGAVAGTRGPEYLAGEAELEFDGLALHLNLLGPGRRSVGRAHPVTGLLDLSLDILGLCYGRPDNDWVTSVPLIGGAGGYLGMIPGSENEVFSRFERTNMKRTAPTTGIAGVMLVAR